MADILDQIDSIFKKNIEKIQGSGDRQHIINKYNEAEGPVAKQKVLILLNDYIRQRK